MKTYLATLTAALLFTSTAWAGDPPAAEAPPAEAPAAEAPAPAAEAPAEPAENCAELEGDAKKACEDKLKEAAAAKAKAEEEAKKAEKGGKAERSNTNRMESEFSDE